MCGIFVSVANRETELEGLASKLRAANALRGLWISTPIKLHVTLNLIYSQLEGPDAQNVHRATVSDSASSSTLSLELFASELRLRGETPVTQPHEQDGDVLCWNGEVDIPANPSAPG